MPIPHFDLANHPPSETIKMITGLLERITKTNDKLLATDDDGNASSAYTCFHARSIPSIDIHSYLARILKYCPCTNECFLSLLVYFDRMSRNSSGLRIDSYNIHRLIIAGIMVASKFFSDIFYTNSRYAKVRADKRLKRCCIDLSHVIIRLEDFQWPNLISWSLNFCTSMNLDWTSLWKNSNSMVTSYCCIGCEKKIGVKSCNGGEVWRP